MPAPDGLSLTSGTGSNSFHHVDMLANVNQESDWIGVVAAARIINRSVVYVQRCDAVLCPVWLGGRRLFRRDAVERFAGHLEARRLARQARALERQVGGLINRARGDGGASDSERMAAIVAVAELGWGADTDATPRAKELPRPKNRRRVRRAP